MADRPDERLPFEIETPARSAVERPGGRGPEETSITGAGDSDEAASPMRSSRFPLSALALVLLLIGVLGYVALRQVGGASSPAAASSRNAASGAGASGRSQTPLPSGGSRSSLTE